MVATLSMDLKERIVRSVKDDGLSQAETARRFAVSESTVSRLMRALRERGTVARVEFVPGPKPRLSEEHFDWLRARLKESPFLSTCELTPLFKEAFPEVAVHRSTILRALRQLGFSFNEGAEGRSERVLLERPAHGRCQGCDLPRRSGMSSGHGATPRVGTPRRETARPRDRVFGRSASPPWTSEASSRSPRGAVRDGAAYAVSSGSGSSPRYRRTASRRPSANP